MTLQISLYYGAAERQLVVTIRRAVDLPPRADGTPRNPYVKLFLLPDRSEKSRRQSAVLVETCQPVWNEPFYYNGLTESMLLERILEVRFLYSAESRMRSLLITLSLHSKIDRRYRRRLDLEE